MGVDTHTYIVHLLYFRIQSTLMIQSVIIEKYISVVIDELTNVSNLSKFRCVFRAYPDKGTLVDSTSAPTASRIGVSNAPRQS